MDLSKTLSKHNKRIEKIKPVISVNVLPPSTNGFLHLARSLALERYEKLVCGIRIFIDWNS